MPAKGQKHSEEAKVKIRIARANQIFTEEICKKISIANSKRIWTKEAKKNLSIAKKGCKYPPLSEEHKNKIRPFP